MGDQMFDNIVNTDLNFSLNLGGILKLPLILVLLGCLLYAFMLFLKLRILKDTIDLEGSTKMRVLVFLNLLISLIICLVGVIIIVLG
ncbi:hypothetical protein GX618_01260 [Candidatus Dojkabacteria bacterium]|jgi:hypothetical protein|uniref:Uncharacterized protein n=1 Tax=Candidatus Dojkabacteria bacterium TaxID=2099670 RepID=A0A847ET70_9BACT|nr:hypothetical protein [Candidatus Dojkabacteria bacterium]